MRSTFRDTAVIARRIVITVIILAGLATSLAERNPFWIVAAAIISAALYAIVRRRTWQIAGEIVDRRDQAIQGFDRRRGPGRDFAPLIGRGTADQVAVELGLRRLADDLALEPAAAGASVHDTTVALIHAHLRKGRVIPATEAPRWARTRGERLRATFVQIGDAIAVVEPDRGGPILTGWYYEMPSAWHHVSPKLQERVIRDARRELAAARIGRAPTYRREKAIAAVIAVILLLVLLAAWAI